MLSLWTVCLFSSFVKTKRVCLLNLFKHKKKSANEDRSLLIKSASLKSHSTPLTDIFYKVKRNLLWWVTITRNNKDLNMSNVHSITCATSPQGCYQRHEVKAQSVSLCWTCWSQDKCNVTARPRSAPVFPPCQLFEGIALVITFSFYTPMMSPRRHH